MSKQLEKKESKLASKAKDRATHIRRVVKEYSATSQTTPGATLVNRHGDREIERAVVKYNEVHKALKRLRKKIAMKDKQGRQNSRFPTMKT